MVPLLLLTVNRSGVVTPLSGLDVTVFSWRLVLVCREFSVRVEGRERGEKLELDFFFYV